MLKNILSCIGSKRLTLFQCLTLWNHLFFCLFPFYVASWVKTTFCCIYKSYLILLCFSRRWCVTASKSGGIRLTRPPAAVHHRQLTAQHCSDCTHTHAHSSLCRQGELTIKNVLELVTLLVLWTEDLELAGAHRLVFHFYLWRSGHTPKHFGCKGTKLEYPRARRTLRYNHQSVACFLR